MVSAVESIAVSYVLNMDGVAALGTNVRGYAVRVGTLCSGTACPVAALNHLRMAILARKSPPHQRASLTPFQFRRNFTQ